VSYLHVPLVLGPDGTRLAKRHGAVTLADLAERGLGPDAVLSLLAVSLGLADDGERVSAGDLVERFDVAQLPRSAWRWTPT
jgi:glutamyl-tRNA synthetase